MGSSFEIEELSYSASRIVWQGGRKVAILFPPLDEAGSYLLYPHPLTFPGLGFAGLPEPLRPEFMAFATLDEVRAFLGVADTSVRAA